MDNLFSEKVLQGVTKCYKVLQSVTTFHYCQIHVFILLVHKYTGCFKVLQRLQQLYTVSESKHSFFQENR